MHGSVHSGLRQIAVPDGYLRQGRLARIFYGKAIAFPSGNSLGNLDAYPSDVANFAWSGVKDQIQLAPETHDRSLTKSSDEVLSRWQAGDESPLFSGLGIKLI